MDNFKLQEEVKALKKLSEHYENQLKLIGFELCDVPDDVGILLDEAVKMQQATNLHDLNLNYLKEFYYTKKKESIDQNAVIVKQEKELKQLTQENENLKREIEILKQFTTSVNSRVVSAVELQRAKTICETKTQGLLDRQDALKVPEDFNIDDIIKKIEMLQTKGKNK